MAVQIFRVDWSVEVKFWDDDRLWDLRAIGRAVHVGLSN